MLIFWIIISWPLVGFLFTLGRTWYWKKVLIKGKVASIYYDFYKTPFLVYLPICIIWPGQAFNWFTNSEGSFFHDSINGSKDGKEDCIPIVPVSFIPESSDIFERTRLNKAAILGLRSYLSYPEKKEEISIKEVLIFNFSLGVAFGWLNLLFWVTGIISWIIILIIYLAHISSMGVSRVVYSAK